MREAFRRSVIPAFLAVAWLCSGHASHAEIAVFTDGRIMKVEDAVLEGERIVLSLCGGGELVVPALRVDRVVDDEVAPSSPAIAAETSCSHHWSPDPTNPATPFADLIAEAAESANLHPRLLSAVVRVESNFDPLAVSRAGARGLTQLMPAAAADQGVSDVFDPAQNLHGGAHHLRALLERFQSLPLALAAYNAGASTVERYGGIPPYRETQLYVTRVLAIFCPKES